MPQWNRKWENTILSVSAHTWSCPIKSLCREITSVAQPPQLSHFIRLCLGYLLKRQFHFYLHTSIRIKHYIEIVMDILKMIAQKKCTHFSKPISSTRLYMHNASTHIIRLFNLLVLWTSFNQRTQNHATLLSISRPTTNLGPKLHLNPSVACIKPHRPHNNKHTPNKPRGFLGAI